MNAASAILATKTPASDSTQSIRSQRRPKKRKRSPQLFAVAAPGLEAVVLREIKALNFRGPRLDEGGVLFNGSPEEIARANLHLRCASRILLRLGSFHASTRNQLAEGLRQIDWSPYLRPGATLDVRATCHKSRLYHSGLVEEVVGEVLDLPLKRSPGGDEEESEGESTVDSTTVSTENPPSISAEDDDSPSINARKAPHFRVQLRLFRDRCTVSIDTSGELLHKRGYRSRISKAPLRETLAAGLIALSGWEGDEAFVDPMCGSGTLPIEAALIASRIAPGLGRSFAFENFPSFDPKLLESLCDQAIAAQRRPEVPIVAADRRAEAIEAAKENAKRAGVFDFIEFQVIDAAELEAPSPQGVLISNPPYGKRIATRKNREELAHTQLSQALKGAFAGYKRYVLAPAGLKSSLGLPVSSTWPLRNGGIAVEFMTFI